VKQAEAIDVPVVGQPDYYRDAVGTRFEVSARCNRSEVHVGQSLTYTVRVQAFGPYWQAPQRPKLDEIPRFSDRFQIARSVSDTADRYLADQAAWEFDFRLEPRSDRVVRIPPLGFSYYRPNPDRQQRGHYLTMFAEEIDLKVKPVTIKKTEASKPITAPDFLFQQAVGPGLLHHESLFILPSPGVLVLLLLAPPAAAALWYVVWRRLYPDAAQRARIRQSRAAREALRALEKIVTPTPALPHHEGGKIASADERTRVVRIAAITAHYLRQRFDLRSVEPTPAEVVGHLRAIGAPEALIDEAEQFFLTADVARFAPRQPELDGFPLAGGDRRLEDFPAAAQRLITALEAYPWSQRS
jgi:hypothetical protein